MSDEWRADGELLQCNEDGWTEWHHPLSPFRHTCCGCKAVHDVETRVADGAVHWRWRRLPPDLQQKREDEARLGLS